MKNSKKRFFTFVSLAAFLFAMLIGIGNSDLNATNQYEYRGKTPDNVNHPCANTDATNCGMWAPETVIKPEK